MVVSGERRTECVWPRKQIPCGNDSKKSKGKSKKRNGKGKKNNDKSKKNNDKSKKRNDKSNGKGLISEKPIERALGELASRC